MTRRFAIRKRTEPKKLREYTDRFTQAFFEDCDRLKIQVPDKVSHATDHIQEMINLDSTLEGKGPYL